MIIYFLAKHFLLLLLLFLLLLLLILIRYALLNVDNQLTVDGSIAVQQKHSYATYAYDSVQAIVRAFAPTLAFSISARRFLNSSSVVQLREATMKRLRETNLPADVTRSGALAFHHDGSDNDRSSSSLQFTVKKRLMTTETLAEAEARGVGATAETSVLVASIHGTKVLREEPAWGTSRWPGLSDTVPLDRPQGTIPKSVYLAMAVVPGDVHTHLLAAQQAVAEINAKTKYVQHDTWFTCFTYFTCFT